MIALLFLLSSVSWGQVVSTAPAGTTESMKLSNIGKDVRELQSGRPQITGVPNYLNGMSVGTAGITWADGTTSTTAAVRASSSVIIVAGTTFPGNGSTVAQATITIHVDSSFPLKASLFGQQLCANAQCSHICDLMVDGVLMGRLQMWYFNSSGLNFDSYIIPIGAQWHLNAGEVATGTRSIAINCYDPAAVAGSFYGYNQFSIWAIH